MKRKVPSKPTITIRPIPIQKLKLNCNHSSIFIDYLEKLACAIFNISQKELKKNKR